MSVDLLSLRPESGWVAAGGGKDRSGTEPVTRGVGGAFSSARRPSETPLTFEARSRAGRAFRRALSARAVVSLFAGRA